MAVLARRRRVRQAQPDGQGTDHFVTIVARQCPEYTDITANRARNDIQESLRDLGVDTPYDAGEPIDPDIEADSQPNCSPLPNWRFTLGTGYQTQAVSGPWGSLSIVTDPYEHRRRDAAADAAARLRGQADRRARSRLRSRSS